LGNQDHNDENIQKKFFMLICPHCGYKYKARKIDKKIFIQFTTYYLYFRIFLANMAKESFKNRCDTARGSKSYQSKGRSRKQLKLTANQSCPCFCRGRIFGLNFMLIKRNN